MDVAHSSDPVERSTILVVDDDVDIRETISMILEDEGYQVACAANGREALDYLRTHGKPDLILLDLMMPVMDGAEFCARKRLDPSLSQIPVVIVTASGQAREHATALNASDLIYKPLALDTLLEKVHACAAPPLRGGLQAPRSVTS